jgi:acyl-CoA synthetase (AMP-forming)/AMP-acid ligase II
VLTELARRRQLSPDALAMRVATPAGWVDTSWSQLCDAAESASARARRLRGRGPVVLLADGTAASAAAIAGLAGAGLDVLLVEAASSYLADPASAVWQARPATVVAPAASVRDLPATVDRLAYEELIEGPAPAHLPDFGREGEILQLTSGSTGEPRAVRQPVRNICQGGLAYRQAFGLSEADAILAAVPLAHSFGLVGGLTASIVSGASLYTLPRFSISGLLAGLRDGATVLLGTPLLYRLLAPVLRSGTAFPALRTALSSGGPLPAGLAAEVGAGLRVAVRQVYGSTEAGMIACQPDTGELWPADSVGVAAPGVRLRIEPEGAAPGQLIVCSPTVFSGYLGGPDRASGAAEEYITGDLASIDEHGRLFLAGRKDTFVNIGGRKVSPRRIERIMSEYPGLRDVFVFGVTAADQEQRLHAAVVVNGSTRVEDIIEFCRSRHLAPYEVPHHVHVLDSIPYTTMGKIDRRKVLAATTGPGVA